MSAEAYAVGFSAWKKPLVRRFLPGWQLRFVPDAGQAPSDATLIAWGSSDLGPAAGPDRPVIRLEDGFIRSAGLGADYVRPLSWVADRRGIHYDSSRPSDLEVLLQHADLPPGGLVRARELRTHLVARGVTKYNVGAGTWTPRRRGRDIVLAVGQVESDAALRFGAPGIRTNAALVRAARAMHPGAHLVYKPHPDVVAGLRSRGTDEHETQAACDEVVVDAPIDLVLAQVDVVHVMTSLAGFEALLRGRHVVTHGQPFYAGWGLTQDQIPVPRRRRRLLLDELVHAALITYPLYASASTGELTTAEAVLGDLAAARAHGPRAARVRRLVARALAAWAERTP